MRQNMLKDIKAFICIFVKDKKMSKTILNIYHGNII